MPGKSRSKRKKRKAKLSGKPETSPVESSGGGGNKSSSRLLVFLFLGCFGAYMMNGDFLMGKDQKANMLFSVNLLKHRSFSIAPPHAPAAFSWKLERTPGDTVPVKLTHWNNEWDMLYRKGQLQPLHPYFMAPTVRPGQYVNVFGIGSTLTILPVYAALNLFTDIASDRAIWWRGAKVTASLLTAGSVVFIFLIMRRFVPPLPAALGALAYGLGTSAWSLSSQALWNQTPYLFFLLLGVWWLVGVEARPRDALYCGAALGMATLCRPTGIIPVVLVGLYLLWLAPPRWLRVPGSAPGGGEASQGRGERPNQPSAPALFLTYALGGLPFAVLLVTYNAYYFGSLFVFGQEIAGERILQHRGITGGIWQTPMAEGLAGILFSPSRGLLVYSPIMVFGFVGAVMAWREPRKYALLIPLQMVVLAVCALSAKRFDWWGGWTYGPRYLAAAVALLTLQMIPVIARVAHTRWMQGVFAALLLYSIAVQVIGAWAYNIVGWNHKNGMDIDQPTHRGRLWSLSDSQLVYYVSHFQSARTVKQLDINHYLEDKAPIIVSPRKSGKPL